MSRANSLEVDARSPRVRAVLTREAIVDAAVAVLDEHGLDGLTMRAVARRLGSAAMSLYRHVASRDELLDLVLERLATDIPDTPCTGDWQEDAAALARDVRAALLRRPQLTVLLTSRTGLGSGGLQTLERALAIFRSAGMSPHDAAFANHALGNYVAGAALWEAAGLAGATGEGRRARAEAASSAMRSLDPEAFPATTWAASNLFAGTADDRFAFGLAVLLDGLECSRPR
jgi:AcrR family transcriptional regulator